MPRHNSNEYYSRAHELQTLPPQIITCEGQRVDLVAIKGIWPEPCVQWQVKSQQLEERQVRSSNLNTWKNIPRATSPRLSFIANREQNGNEYRALIKTRCECLVTNVAHLTVNYIELILNPVSQCVAVGNPVTFTAAAEGRPIPTVQWQVSTNGGITWTNIPGATSNSLTFVKQPGTENNLYRAVFTNSCGTVISSSASASLDPIIITLQPVSVCYVVGDSVTFTADATGYSTVQWQVSTNGGSTWTDLVGETTTSLNFIIAVGQQNNLYRAVFTNSCGTVISASASTSRDPIIITLQPVSVCYVVGDPVTFTADATGYLTVQWQVSTNGGSTWADLVGETTTSLNFIIVAGQQNNLYRAVFSGECSFAITNTATLFIYNETFTNNDGGYTVLNTGTPTNGGPWIYSAVNDRWEVHGSETGFASALRSPIINIPVNATLALTFNHIYNLQRGIINTFAGGNIKISINGGAFSLVPLSSFFVNGYNYILSPGFNNPLEGQPAWSGQQLIESASAAILGAFTAGDTLQIEFDGGWGDEVLRHSPNWTIDDVTVSCANSIEIP